MIINNNSSDFNVIESPDFSKKGKSSLNLILTVLRGLNQYVKRKNNVNNNKKTVIILQSPYNHLKSIRSPARPRYSLTSSRV